MSKCIHVVNVNNYLPELTKYTLPNLEAFADKIGADFKVITERKFPEFPATYEKLQIHEIGKKYEWNILVDADAQFFPGMFDPTMVTPFDHVGYFMGFDASLLFEPDEYFARDGRKLGISTCFMCVHRACHDVWTPLDTDWETARSKTKREFIIDEYCVSRNVARFGLKVTGMLEGAFTSLFHHFDVNSKTPNLEEVVEKAKNNFETWKW